MDKETDRLCRLCKWDVPGKDEKGWDDKCIEPRNIEEPANDATIRVTGISSVSEPKYRLPLCVSQRSEGLRNNDLVCGPEGKWFANKLIQTLDAG